MPETAHLFEQPSTSIPNFELSWSGELHGEVGAMYRAIEQRLRSGAFDLAVVPLPVRPVEKLIARASRATGWLALAGAAAGVTGMMFTALG